jgi:ATP-binding cassette, subfamily B, multidrug efflux pump
VTEEQNSGKVFDWYILKRLYSYITPYKRVFYALVLMVFLNGALTPIRPFLIQLAIDNHISVGDMEGLTVLIWWLVGLLILQSVVQYASTYLSGWVGQTIINDIRSKLFNHLLKLKLRFFDTNPIGRLVTRNVSDIETLSDVFSEGLAAMIGDLLQLVFILALMFYTDWKLTLVSLSMFPLLVISTYIFKEKIKSAFTEVRTAVAKLNSFVQEQITGMSIVQIFNRDNEEFKKFQDINKEHTKANMRSILYYSIYFPVAEVINAAGIGLLVWYGAKGVISEEVTLGTLVAFIMYINMFFRPIRQIADRFNTLQMGIVSCERIFKLLDRTDVIVNAGDKKPDNFKGTIQFNNVSFGYTAETEVLKNITFDIEAGKTLALVGSTGSGKTTIISLLNRFYDIEKGQILIDGIDIKEYDLSFLRRNVGVVLQDVFLFSGTIADNLSLGNPEITREMMWKAAEMVGATTFIEKLPGKFDYNVMERGSTLSVGQRQLISIIRAMLYNPKIIILDEATSSVDSESEELIQLAIEKMMQGRTSVVIAHRLSTIQKASKILVLDKGEIKESGTHEELLKQSGLYSNLHKMQLKLLSVA